MTEKQTAKVLIVEDELIVALDMKDMLEGLGYGVAAIAGSGERAIRKAGETLPDLILMDVRLNNGIDGIGTAREIRACFNIPVIYLTAYSDEDTVERAKATAPYGYILKPFEKKELNTAIRLALYKHSLEKKIREEAVDSLAGILGGAELILDDGLEKHDPETLRKVELIRDAAQVIGRTIEKL